MRCEAITLPRRSRGDYLKWVGGGQCKRAADYTETGTDGRVRHLCRQHACDGETLITKRSKTPRHTCIPIR